MSYIGNPIVTQAFVTDQFNGNGSTTAFTMSVAPANTASILVAVSGVLQAPDTYSVNGLTLTFSAAPPSGTGNVSVRYLGIPASGVTNTAYRTVTEFTATASQTTFSTPSYTVGFINVYRNGVRLGSADFTASNGTTVVLTSGATAGDLVVTESFFVSSVLNAIPAAAGAVNDTYLNTGAVTQSKLAAGVAGTGPAFAAWQSVAQTLPSNTRTKLRFQTEEFDTANCFDSTTNYRFTPNVAGYYQVNGGFFASTTFTGGVAEVWKNGSTFKSGQANQVGGANQANGWDVSVLVYLNGTTDYVELYGLMVAGQDTYASQANTYFQAFMVRAA